LAPSQLLASPDLDAWSAYDVLAHLRACADVWSNRIAAILAEDQPALRAVNPRSWMKQTDYLDLEFRRSLRTFAWQRADLSSDPRPLTPKDWVRAATVTGAGKVREWTMLFYGQRLARHERQHGQQAARIVATVRGRLPLADGLARPPQVPA